MEIGGVLGLGIDADRPSSLGALFRQSDHLGEGGHLEPAVITLVTERQPLLRPQRSDLSEREVLGEPASDFVTINLFSRLSRREFRMVGDVGGLRDFVLMAGDQDAILRRNQVWLDEIGTHLDCELIGGNGVLGTVSAGAAMGDDEGGKGDVLHDCNRSYSSGVSTSCTTPASSTGTSRSSASCRFRSWRKPTSRSRVSISGISRGAIARGWPRLPWKTGSAMGAPDSRIRRRSSITVSTWRLGRSAGETRSVAPRRANSAAPPRAPIPSRIDDSMPRPGSGFTALSMPDRRAQPRRSSSSGAVTSTISSTPPPSRAFTTPATSGPPLKGRSSLGRPIRREAPAAGRTATVTGTPGLPRGAAGRGGRPPRAWRRCG